MKVASRLCDAASPDDEFPVIHTQFNKDGARTGILTTALIGTMAQRKLQGAARKFLNRFLDVHENTYPNGLLYVADLDSEDSIDTKMRQSLLRAHDGDAVIYLCATPAIRDTALNWLAVPAITAARGSTLR